MSSNVCRIYKLKSTKQTRRKLKIQASFLGSHVLRAYSGYTNN